MRGFDFRRYGGKFDDVNRTRFPGSGDLSRTRGCTISSGPVPVKIFRAGDAPFRTTRRTLEPLADYEFRREHLRDHTVKTSSHQGHSPLWFRKWGQSTVTTGVFAQRAMVAISFSRLIGFVR